MEKIERIIEGYKVLFAIDSVEALQKVETGMLLAADARCYEHMISDGACLDCIVQLDAHEMPEIEKRRQNHDYDLSCSFVAMTPEDFTMRNDDMHEGEGEELEYGKTYDNFGMHVTSDDTFPFWYAVAKITDKEV